MYVLEHPDKGMVVRNPNDPGMFQFEKIPYQEGTTFATDVEVRHFIKWCMKGKDGRKVDVKDFDTGRVCAKGSFF